MTVLLLVLAAMPAQVRALFVGEVGQFAGATTPTGWLAADGSAVFLLY